MMYSQNANPNHFSLVEVMLDKGVSERELNEDEKPWLIIQKKRRVCVNALVLII
jgi:diacylglycerol kinase (ATP)